MVDALIIFASAFSIVFFLGLQSLFVNSGRRWQAFFTSFLIGASHIALYKLVPSATGMEIGAYLLGGPFGIITAMEVFERYNIRRFAKSLEPK